MCHPATASFEICLFVCGDRFGYIWVALKLVEIGPIMVLSLLFWHQVIIMASFFGSGCSESPVGGIRWPREEM